MMANRDMKIFSNFYITREIRIKIIRYHFILSGMVVKYTAISSADKIVEQWERSHIIAGFKDDMTICH